MTSYLMKQLKRDNWLSPSFRDAWAPFFSDFEENSLGFVPDVNIRETKDAYILDVDLPGIEEKDINVEINDGMLTISGERKIEKEDDREDYHRREISYGSFKRSFTVGDNVDANRISAKYKSGALKIKLPKAEKVKPKAIKIDVN